MNGEKHIINPYTAFFIPAGCPHEYYSTDESWDTHWIKPSGKSCTDMLKALGFDKHCGVFLFFGLDGDAR